MHHVQGEINVGARLCSKNSNELNCSILVNNDCITQGGRDLKGTLKEAFMGAKRVLSLQSDENSKIFQSLQAIKRAE